MWCCFLIFSSYKDVYTIIYNPTVESFQIFNEQEAHGPQRSPGKNLKIDKHMIIIMLIKRRKTHYMLYENWMVLHLNKLESPSPKNALWHVWLKLVQWFLRRRFLNFVNVFLLFWNNLPLEKGGALHLNKLESASPKDALCQVLLKLVQCFLKRFLKVFFPEPLGKFQNRLAHKIPEWRVHELKFLQITDHLIFKKEILIFFSQSLLWYNNSLAQMCIFIGWNWFSGEQCGQWVSYLVHARVLMNTIIYS